ncbi:2-hydroxyacid dehydrogenase [Chachezhania antarctica]|uniref:2-hydroxyacid dehydrogenase n=1 Tax=Chachezhania antarctica TaxID=2340860 RepID=UPI000EABF9A9|nr:glyoxylate/hydroxypyruvate reductase A [Chachezhania antarctica]|tara:strand:+ start:3455 stop:4354 length:900 start_codon:yes stop_codon:yes gene_type:complete
MKGVITSEGGIDLMQFYRKHFEAQAPDIELLGKDEITDPAEVDFVLTFRPAPGLFTGMSNLKAVFSAGAGTDAIDICPSLPTHVPLYPVKDDDQALQMAGYVAFHVIWHHRNMFHTLEMQRKSEWSRVTMSMSPERRRIGILGFGFLGRAIATGLTGLGYPVSGFSRSAPDPHPGVTHYHGDQLDEFLAGTNILVNVLPLTPQTKGMLNADLFAKLPKRASLIQIGRGGQVVEPDLIRMIDEGHMSGATMDVFATEPLPPEDPLWTHPRIVITPHSASLAEAKNVTGSIIARLRELQPA